MTSFISSMCLSFCLCLPVSFSLTAPLNQLMRCLRKYQSRTPSPLLHSVPSEIVFDFEPGPVFRGSWALLSCFHPNKISKTTDAVCASPSHRVYVSVWVYQNTSVFCLAWLECFECAFHTYSLSPLHAWKWLWIKSDLNLQKQGIS